MRDYIDIGSSPASEDCVQVGAEDCERKSKIECRHYIAALRKKLGEEPFGAQLRIKSNPHDFGTYYEVVCYYEEEDEDACSYAFKCESDGPETWAEVGMSAPDFSSLAVTI